MYNAAVVAFIMSLSQPSEMSGEICGYQIKGVESFIDDLMSQGKGEIILATSQILSIKEEAKQRVWSIGKLTDSTPVIVCREVVRAADKYRIDVHALCSGPPEECAAFVQRFRS